MEPCYQGRVGWIGALWESRGAYEFHGAVIAVVQREIAVNNGMELSKEEFRLGKSGQVSQWERSV